MVFLWLRSEFFQISLLTTCMKTPFPWVPDWSSLSAIVADFPLAPPGLHITFVRSSMSLVTLGQMSKWTTASWGRSAWLGVDNFDSECHFLTSTRGDGLGSNADSCYLRFSPCDPLLFKTCFKDVLNLHACITVRLHGLGMAWLHGAYELWSLPCSYVAMLPCSISKQCIWCCFTWN